MRIARALKYVRRGQESVEGIFQGARLSGTPSDALNGYFRTVFKNMKDRKCPQWAVSEVRGYRDALSNQLWHSMTFMYTMPDGTMMSVDRSRDDYHDKFGTGPREVYSRGVRIGHYYPSRGEMDRNRVLRPYYSYYADTLYPKGFLEKLIRGVKPRPHPKTFGDMFTVLRYTLAAGGELRKEDLRIVREGRSFDEAMKYCKHRCSFSHEKVYDMDDVQDYVYFVHRDHAVFLK